MANSKKAKAAAATGAEVDTADLLDNPLLSDVILRQIDGDGSNSEDFYAHKQILANHSKWFLRAFSHHSREDKIIEVRGDSLRTFERMLQFFYTNTWKCPAGVPDIVVYVCHVHVYAIGEKYGCDKLQEYTLSRFRRLTDDYDGSDEEFMDMVVKAHYEKAAKRDCAMGRAIARFIMRKNAAFLRSGQAADLVKTYPNFARDIFLECHEIGSCSIWQT